MTWIKIKDKLPEREYMDVLGFCPRKLFSPYAICRYFKRKDGEIWWSVNGSSGGPKEVRDKHDPEYWHELPGRPKSNRKPVKKGVKDGIA